MLRGGVNFLALPSHFLFFKFHPPYLNLGSTIGFV
jgi:hypothetical protein